MSAAADGKSRKRGLFKPPSTGPSPSVSNSPSVTVAVRRRSGENVRGVAPPQLPSATGHQVHPSPSAGKLRARSPGRLAMSSTYCAPTPAALRGGRYPARADAGRPSVRAPLGPRSTSLERTAPKRSTSKDRAIGRYSTTTTAARTGVRSSSADRAKMRDGAAAQENGVGARPERMVTAPHPKPRPKAFAVPSPKTPQPSLRTSVLVNSKTSRARASARSPGAQLRRGLESNASGSAAGARSSPSPIPEIRRKAATPTISSTKHAATATFPQPKPLMNERGRGGDGRPSVPVRTASTGRASTARTLSSGAVVGRKSITRSQTHSHQAAAKKTGAQRTHSLPGAAGSPNARTASPRMRTAAKSAAAAAVKASPPAADPDDHLAEQNDLNYGEGGYGLVWSGDVLDDRYELVQQVGRGQSSTVWLARDQRASAHGPSEAAPEYVAIKLTRCSKNVRCSSSHEVALLYYISRNTIGHDGVARLLDHFEYEGKHGVHVCMVFELLGRPLDALMASTGFRGLKDMTLVKNITVSILETLKQLKQINVVHTDLKPENLMFVRVNDVEDASDSSGKVKISDFGLSFLLKAKDGLKPNGEPYSESDLRVIRASNYVKGALIQTREYRAPEIVLGNDFSCETDIWSLACIVFEMVTGRFLFDPKSKPGVTDEMSNDFEHLSEITQLIGRPTIGSGVLKGGVFTRNFYDKDGRFKGTYNNLMTDTFSLVLTACRDRSEASLIFDFIMSCLTWSPDTRPTAEDCLKHPWLSGYESDAS
eukprot:TRINITY_DN5045_c0_g1_i1.p1 TRINITY_DN5045_c0_g1~~TRINITY_DN5045_c0_g1_i1.p1  ORF type:complete len:767 (+),score=219.96 TRINITY_DN5045_c0_g1_i1:80-2380(+)